MNNREKQKRIRNCFELQPEYDSYEEWINKTFNLSEKAKKHKSYKEIKKILEDVLQRREEITYEELENYMEYNHMNRKTVIVQLLALYQDIYRNEEGYDKKLVDDTIKYFNLSDKALAWARKKVPTKEVQKELENDIPTKNKTN